MFKTQGFTVHFTGDDRVGVPSANAGQAIAEAEARAITDAVFRQWSERKDIVPWHHVDGTPCKCRGACQDDVSPEAMAFMFATVAKAINDAG